MREQPCRDASAQHTPAVSTCALPAGLLARRSTGIAFRLPEASGLSDEVERIRCGLQLRGQLRLRASSYRRGAL